MGKKILDSKILYIVLSILIAVALWFYVTSLDGNEDTKRISGIPVTFSGVETLEERGLMIVGNTPTASVTVRAPTLILAQLTDKTVKLTVDVSRITEASVYTLAYTVSLPSDVNADRVEYVSGGTGNVTFTVARYTHREIEVRGQFVGSAAEGCLAGDSDDFLFSPGTITISGQSELVNQVAYARVTVDGEELTESINGDYPFEFIGASGDVLEDLDVTCSADTVYTTFPILATAEIPLKLTFTAGGGVDESRVRCTMSTESITVAGSRDAVAAIQEEGALILGNIDLAGVHDGDELTYPIPLTDELTNISGVSEVKVTIRLDSSLVSKVIEVEQIDPINVPEGWSVSVMTQVIAVEVRGDPALVNAVLEEHIRVTADLKDIKLAAGQYTVPAKIYLDSVGMAGQVGVVGTDYKVVVTLTRS